MSWKMSKSEKKLLRLEARKLSSRANPNLHEFELDQELYAAYVLQRTLNERASEKYTRLQASEKGTTVWWENE